MQTTTKIAVLSGFIFLIPLNIYSIGGGLGSGIQWALVKYQCTTFGNTFFSVIQDIEYVLTGIIHGRSALSLVLWSAGSGILLGITILAALFMIEVKQEIRRLFGIITILVGFLYLLSCMFQYGPTLSGPAGFCIPIGVPLIWAIGLCIYSDFLRINKNKEIGENDDILIKEN
jgi:hypothetical protein